MFVSRIHLMTSGVIDEMALNMIDEMALKCDPGMKSRTSEVRKDVGT